VLQCAAVCSSVQHVAVRLDSMSLLINCAIHDTVAVCCSVLQRVADSGVLQCA